MITVAILINGQPLVARSAVNQSTTRISNHSYETKYTTDAGDVIWHDRELGAIELAKQMLDTIKIESLK